MTDQLSKAIAARRGDWVAASHNDETVMMSVESGRIIGVNAMGARIWEMLDQPREIAWLRNALLAEFRVSPEQCAVELDAFLAEMTNRGAIVLHDAPAG